MDATPSGVPPFERCPPSSGGFLKQQASWIVPTVGNKQPGGNWTAWSKAGVAHHSPLCRHKPSTNPCPTRVAGGTYTHTPVTGLSRRPGPPKPSKEKTAPFCGYFVPCVGRADPRRGADRAASNNLHCALLEARAWPGLVMCVRGKLATAARVGLRRPRRPTYDTCRHREKIHRAGQGRGVRGLRGEHSFQYLSVPSTLSSVAQEHTHNSTWVGATKKSSAKIWKPPKPATTKENAFNCEETYKNVKECVPPPLSRYY